MTNKGLTWYGLVGQKKKMTILLRPRLSKAVKSFKLFHEKNEAEKFTITDSRRKTEEEVYRILKKKLNGAEPNSIIKLPKNERNEKIRNFREMGLSIRQIERVTGVSRGTIAKC